MPFSPPLLSPLPSSATMLHNRSQLWKIPQSYQMPLSQIEQDFKKETRKIACARVRDEYQQLRQSCEVKTALLSSEWATDPDCEPVFESVLNWV
jgi:hypothetical protein